MFSDDADTPTTSVEISFLQYKHDGFWDFPKTLDVKIIDTKFVFYGPSTPLAPTKNGFVFEEDEKVARVYKTKQNYCRHWKLLLHICLNIQDNIFTYTDNFILHQFSNFH